MGRSKNCEKRILSPLCLFAFRLFVRMEKTRLPLDGFSLNLILKYFFESLFKKIQVVLKFDENNGHIIWRPMYSCRIVLGMRNVP